MQNLLQGLSQGEVVAGENVRDNRIGFREWVFPIFRQYHGKLEEEYVLEKLCPRIVICDSRDVAKKAQAWLCEFAGEEKST